MGAWICPTCRLHYGEEARRRCPADGARLVLNLSGASVQGHILTHLLHVSPDGSTLWEASSAANERVALKLLRGPQDVATWAAAQGLVHANIVRLRAYAAIDDDLACVVMDWVDGEPLAATLLEGPLPVPTALGVADQLLDALAYVHAQDLVHGDVSATTVFLGAEDRAQLLDVGVHRQPPLVELLGTGGAEALELHMVACSAPERLALGETTAASDLYSIGALLWHMLTGEPAYGRDPHFVARAHMTAPPPSLEEARPDRRWPPGLDAIIARAMAARPDARFESAEAMRAALAPVFKATMRVESAPPVVQTVAPPQAPQPVAIVAPPPPVARVQPPDDAMNIDTLKWVAVVGLFIIGFALLIRSIDDRPDSLGVPGGADAPRIVAGSQAPATTEVERVRATPLVAPTTQIARAPATVAPVTAAPMSAAPLTVAPATAASQAIASAAPPSVAPAPVSEAAPATEIAAAPVSAVATEPPAPVAPRSEAPATRAPANAVAGRIARPTPPRAQKKRPKRVRKPVKRPKRPKRRPKRTVTAKTPAAEAGRISTLGAEKPPAQRRDDGPRVRILGD